MKINNQRITTYRIYKIFWLIFWSYFVTFLGNSISINRPKYKPISIQWVRCRSQLYQYTVLDLWLPVGHTGVLYGGLCLWLNVWQTSVLYTSLWITVCQTYYYMEIYCYLSVRHVCSVVCWQRLTVCQTYFYIVIYR